MVSYLVIRREYIAGSLKGHYLTVARETKSKIEAKKTAKAQNAKNQANVTYYIERWSR